jgi:hypothetical protein
MAYIGNMAKLVPMAALQNPRVFSKVRMWVEKAASQGLLCVRGRSAMHFEE